MKKKQQFKSRKKNINGVILLDKPTGMSSNQALHHFVLAKQPK